MNVLLNFQLRQKLREQAYNRATSRREHSREDCTSGPEKITP